MQASWIDSDELRTLAASLLDPVEETHEEAWSPEPLLDDVFIAEIARSLAPFAFPASTPASTPIVYDRVAEPTAELETLRNQLRTIREEAQAAGLLSVTQEECTIAKEPSVVTVLEVPVSIAVEPTVSPQIAVKDKPVLSKMSQRLQGLQQFATELTSCKELLLMSQEGDLLWGVAPHDDIMATIMMAVRFHNPLAFEATHFKLTNLDDTLVVLSTPTQHGVVFMALINAIHTDELNLQRLNNAMIHAIVGAPVS